MNDQPRPVWLDSETIVAINQALIDADQRGVNERWLTWNLGAIVAAWDAAPADATEAVEQGILGTFPDLVGVRVSLGMDRSERAATACARAVLRALGHPS